MLEEYSDWESKQIGQMCLSKNLWAPLNNRNRIYNFHLIITRKEKAINPNKE